MTSWEFNAAGPIKADIKLPAGDVKVAAGPTEIVTVTLLPAHGSGGKAEKLIADTEVSFEDETLTVHVPKRVQLRGDTSLHLTVELPEGSSVAVDTASADVSCTGDLGSLNAHTASGDVTAGRIPGDVGLSTASGDVRLQEVNGDIRLQSASGDAVIQRADGEISVNTASGDLVIGQAGKLVQAKTASGDIQIDRIATGRADVATVSGDVYLGVAPGIGIYLDLSSVSGRVRSELDSDEEGGRDGDPSLTLRCSSVSGDIRITRANPA